MKKSDSNHRDALLKIMNTAAIELGYENEKLSQFISERESAIKTLRIVCADHGDNNWTDELHLSDIIEKHLARHLESSRPDSDESSATRDPSRD